MPKERPHGTVRSYIVRIYGPDTIDPEGIVGVVEAVGSDTRKAFAGMRELWKILRPGLVRARLEEQEGGDSTGGGPDGKEA